MVYSPNIIVLLVQMSQATQSVAEDAGSVTVCAEINNTTLPLQRSATVQIFSVSSSAGSKLNNYDPVLKEWLKNDVLYSFFV